MLTKILYTQKTVFYCFIDQIALIFNEQIYLAFLYNLMKIPTLKGDHSNSTG